MADKKPSFQFYPGDWMKDPALRSVSPSARGLWIDMLCLLFESDRRGYLQHITGKPVSEEQLARMTGCSAELVSTLLQELENSGVFSKNEHGIIYSRRLLRDEQLRENKSRAGKQGMEKRWGYNRPITDTITEDITKHNSSSSSSSSSSKPTTTGPPLASVGVEKAYKINSPGQEVVAAYKLLTGVELEDRKWDSVYYPRFKKQAESLLKLFSGDVETCCKCMEGIKTWAERLKLDWTLETVVKRASDWKNGRLYSSG